MDHKIKTIKLLEKRVLVSGGAGAIGSNLVERLVIKHRCKVTVVDDFSQGHRSNLANLIKNNQIRLITGDINKPKVLNDAFKGGFDVVYHLAASFANELSVENPLHDLECNIQGTLNLLLKSAKENVKLFVYASSSSLYGPREEQLFSENLYPNPSTPYAVSKLTGEFYCNSMGHLYGMNHISLRFSNTYGPKDFPGRYRNVIPNFMRKALLGEPLPITGTGNETRDYTYIDDTISGILQASENSKAYNKIFNLGTGKATKTLEIAKEILRVTGSKSKIKFMKPRYFDHVKNRQMDVSKARISFDYDPKTSVREGIEKTYAWFREHQQEALGSK